MEKLDLYTEDRIPTGRTVVRGNPVPKGLCRLVIHVCIFNSKGEILIQHRPPFKDGWRNLWDISCGGSAIAGESSRKAAERETLEELGLSISLENERPLLTVNFDRGFNDFYVITKDVSLSELKLQKEEVDGARWATLDQILEMIDREEFIPYHKDLLKLLFKMKDINGALTKNDYT